MRTPSILFKQKEGVSLIELLVALVILGIVIGAIYRLFIVQTKAYTVQDQAVEVQQNVRSAMEILLRDLRMTGYDDDSAASNVTVSTPIATPYYDNGITVSYEYAAANAASNTINYELHTVNYWADANSVLQRTFTVTPGNQTTEPILENVALLNFSYGIDTNNDGVVDSWVNAAGVGGYKIIAVQVTLTARPDQTNPDVQKSVSPRTLISAVMLRNLIMK